MPDSSTKQCVGREAQVNTSRIPATCTHCGTSWHVIPRERSMFAENCIVAFVTLSHCPACFLYEPAAASAESDLEDSQELVPDLK